MKRLFAVYLKFSFHGVSGIFICQTGPLYRVLVLGWCRPGVQWRQDALGPRFQGGVSPGGGGVGGAGGGGGGERARGGKGPRGGGAGGGGAGGVKNSEKGPGRADPQLRSLPAPGLATLLPGGLRSLSGSFV